jgi:hydroxymethylglutaryl-CoA synthase
MINKKSFSKVGVVGFGAYVPSYRITVAEIAKANQRDGQSIATSLGVKQKAVAGRDEDTVSISVAAATIALSRSVKLTPDNLGAVLVGSESHPYTVKPTGSIVAEILGVGRDYLTADLEFACKAGTTGVILIAAMIEAGLIDSGLAIGADVAQSRPGDALEYTAGAGGAAIVLGNSQYPWLAKLEKISSFNSDTPDFWRREGEKYPNHAGRFTGEPAYLKHVIEGTQTYLKKFKQQISDFDQVILHMPNGKFPQRAAAKLGVSSQQLKTGLVVEEIGNPYSGSAMTGLINVLENAKKGERVLMTSYGSGAGSDSLSLTVSSKNLLNKKADLKNQLKTYEQISYAKYLQLKK